MAVISELVTSAPNGAGLIVPIHPELLEIRTEFAGLVSSALISPTERVDTGMLPSFFSDENIYFS